MKAQRYSDAVPIHSREETNEVAVFEIGIRPGHFVVRAFGIGVLGDSEWTSEPDDEQLKELFGEDVKIRREYAVAPSFIEREIYGRLSKSILYDLP